MSQEIFKNLKAVKNKQVYKLPVGGYRWGVPHVEIPLTWLWLYQLIDGSESIHLKKEMKHAYKSLYNYDISDEEIKQILSLDINKNTKNYSKLLD
jgi:iron complex transport system substrate-binding protein